jgi:hypothetical protein
MSNISMNRKKRTDLADFSISLHQMQPVFADCNQKDALQSFAAS